MTLIELIQAFEKASVGVLNATEQAVYIRLVLIWNGLRRPEWFSVSDPQLKREAGIKSHHTIAKAKKTLQDKGFITMRNVGKGLALMFHLNQMTTTVENAVPTVENAVPTTANNAIGVGQNLPYPTAENAVPPRQNLPTSQSTEITESIQSSRETSPTPPTVSPEVMKAYQEEIRLVASPRDMGTLHDYETMYPQDGWVVKAIERAALRNKRNLGYVGSILRSWKENGYDEEGDRQNGQNGQGTRRNAQRAPRQTGSDWSQVTEYRPGWG